MSGSGTRDEGSGPPYDEDEEQHGGEPACYLNRVCDACGRLVEDGDVCPACGARLA